MRAVSGCCVRTVDTGQTAQSEKMVAALVRMTVQEPNGELVDLPGELLMLTGVAGRICPPSVARAWVTPMSPRWGVERLGTYVRKSGSIATDERLRAGTSPGTCPGLNPVGARANNSDPPSGVRTAKQHGNTEPRRDSHLASAGVQAGAPPGRFSEERTDTSQVDEVCVALQCSTKNDSARSHLEIEWQFDTADLLGIETALLARPLELEPRVIPGDLTAIEDRYLDTADLRLLRAGYACRLRTTPTGQELTLKSATTVTRGPQRRVERTQALDADEDLAGAQSTAGEVSDLVRLVAGQRPLLPLFDVRTSRRTFFLVVKDNRAGEISLDRTTITPLDDGEAVRLRRVEIEVAGGTESSEAVRKFAISLRKAHQLRWGRQSKFELGLQSGGWLRRAAIDLGPTEIQPGISIDALAQAVMRRHLADLLYH